MFVDQVIHFGGNLGDQVKGRSPKKFKSLIRVPYVPHVKVQVLSFNLILISSPWRVPSPSYPIRGEIGRLGKGSFTENAKIVDRGALCSEPESTGCKLQYDPDHFSVPCSKTKLSISGKIWENR